ncbi:MAG: nuclear transport factor 2 family protein [Verrucomicrobia bacterium]|nr:nuclear transport factor 2 family protein [Verrucomicrobiota bacterium]
MKHRSRLPLLLFFLVSLAMPQTTSSATATGANAGERKSVLDVVQRFFDTMAAKDVDGARAVLLPDGQYYAVRDDPGGFVLRRRTHEEYLAGLATGKDRPLERMWDATVMVHDRIAMVWTPYDFHRNGKFSHSGIDVFTLVKTDGGWKIAGLAFTVEPKTPSQHPAGPPPVAPGN